MIYIKLISRFYNRCRNVLRMLAVVRMLVDSDLGPK